MRVLIKAVLIIAVLWIVGTIVGVMRAIGTGSLPMFIVGIAMLAAIKAIWSYKPSSSKEISLDKESK